MMPVLAHHFGRRRNHPRGTGAIVTPTLVFTGQPSTVVAGAVISPNVVVTAQNTGGTTDTAFTGNVTVALGANPSGATLGGTLTRAAVAGVATFTDLTVSLAGNGDTLVASASGLTGGTSATFNVTASGGNNPNEPAGFTVISDRAFNADGENGWSANTDAGNHFSIVTDATAPRSPSNVGQANYPIGWNIGGNDPISTQIAIASGNYSQLYHSFWVKLSSNWIPHPSGTNKIGFTTIGGTPNTYLCFQHSSFPMSAFFKMQNGSQTNSPDTNGNNPGVNLGPNVSDVPLNANIWYHWEVLMQFNTASNYDGVARWWINGTEAGRWTNIRYSTTTHIFGEGSGVSWKPIYGGSGSGTLSVAMQMWMDHYYLSGKV